MHNTMEANHLEVASLINCVPPNDVARQDQMTGRGYQQDTLAGRHAPCESYNPRTTKIAQIFNGGYHCTYCTVLPSGRAADSNKQVTNR